MDCYFLIPGSAQALLIDFGTLKNPKKVGSAPFSYLDSGRIADLYIHAGNALAITGIGEGTDQIVVSAVIELPEYFQLLGLPAKSFRYDAARMVSV